MWEKWKKDNIKRNALIVVPLLFEVTTDYFIAKKIVVDGEMYARKGE